MTKAFKLSAAQKVMLADALIVSGLSEEERNALLSCATAVRHEVHGNLFRERDEARYFYCVLSGYVRLYRLGGDGREADIRICEPGDSFGECLLLDGGGYNYSAQAMEHAMLARFDLAKVRALLEARPRIGTAILRSLSRHLLSTIDCLASDRMQTAPQRVAGYLLTHSTQQGVAASLRLPFQKSLLARKLGLAPEALSRAFSTLREAGVTVSGRSIEISNLNTLKEI
ncbi:Crp/Fnr family transcriptional regulator [Rhizobium sp. Root1220]|uniref:Crp/Fnr family transcriptional regulator n=1 Tax=Rhizobium sp. Root1220 TaxID=1736432 RepID=UPI0006FAC7F6|nr:Crp/Fnr family transcriptional regulator [Rhizobium sp. Root1220]KQV83732.1 Crp/Fnr family transcriptional regulator [Rhizobium sp. Root1220]